MKLNYKSQLFGLLMATFAFATNSNAQLYEFYEHTFTNAGVEGKDGPTLIDCQLAYVPELWVTDPGFFNMTTNGIQEWTVPATGEYQIIAAGAQGGNDLYTVDPEEGGLGASMTGFFYLTEGDVLYIIVGQQGEHTRVTDADNAASGGGGGTFVWDSTDDAMPLIAAGGGAGGSGQDHTGRHATADDQGNNSWSVPNYGSDGNGGRSNAGGSGYWAGGGCGWLTNGTAGASVTDYLYYDGALIGSGEGGRRPLEGGIGGERFIIGSDDGGDGGFGGGGGGGSDNMGTGGGGGYSGGGGERGDASPDNSGGGGGSYNGGTDQENVAAFNSGHGYVVITLWCNALTLSDFETEFCAGDELILDATTESGEAVTWDMGVENGVSFTPPTGTTTYTASSVGPDDCSFQTTILVHALPVVTTTADETEICDGETITLTSVGATTYSWDPFAEDGVAFTPDEGTTTYTVTGTDDNGCENTATIDLTVNPLPIVTATSDGDLACIGSDVILSGEGATTYTWDPADVTDGEPYTMDALGSYSFTVTGTDDNGCIGEDNITIDVFDLPTVDTFLEDEIICLGSSTTFSGTGADTYVWDMGVINGEDFTPDAVGTLIYTVTGTDIIGCQNTATVDLEVTENTLELTSVIIPETVGDDGEIDITVTGGTPAYTFDWDNDGTGDFDDMEDLIGLAEGTYTIHIIDDEGCELIAELILVDQARIAELNADLIAVYPNPTTDFITVTFQGEFNYSLFTINGAMVLNGIAVDSESISLSTLSRGEYLLQLVSEGQSQIMKIVKQ